MEVGSGAPSFASFAKGGMKTSGELYSRHAHRIDNEALKMDLTSLTPPELLQLHSKISDQLRERGITRSSNSPTGDLAEYLFCKAFGWTQAGNSRAKVDALGLDGTRYQIKGCRITRFSKSRQLSAIRDMNGSHFDYLAGVLFNEDYTVFRAGLIPHAFALERSTYVKHTNSHRFLLRDDIWKSPNVRDITKELRDVQF